ncbi:MAG: hypothetical protein HUJ29_03430 [Gammaproteobacteria bacterium]|nr:hypothetical protein [Gammaproteobacteria bacterium]
MYKRRAHILFVYAQALDRVALTRQVRRIGDDWLEAKMKGPDDAIEPEHLAWADLVVALDETSCHRLQTARISCPYRCWRLRPGLQWHTDLQQQIQSMVGGMKLLQRLDP